MTQQAQWTRVTTAGELMDAVRSEVPAIDVSGVLRGMPMLTLPPGVRLRGGTLVFGARGIRLTSDNTLEDVTVHCPDHETAICNDTAVEELGTLTLRRVRTRGQVLLVARDAVRFGHVQVEDLTVESADVRGRAERPHGFGVDALQGAFTLWNRQPDPGSVITAELLDLAAGSDGAPVRGSGVFVGGHGDEDGRGDGGTVRVGLLRTGEIHTDGGIPPGTPDLISGGVFVISGARVEKVHTAGPVTSYGQNDMVLDNWGRVISWEATAPITSVGPSGIGFVNFGDLDHLDVRAPLTTHGVGARGFNVYDGTLQHAEFDSITTTGDGAIGVQVSRDLPQLDIRGDLTTSGGTGSSLVRGVQTELAATALSVKPGGRIGRVTVGGRIASEGDRLTTVEVDGELDSLTARGGISAAGQGADAVHVGDFALDLSGVTITAVHGRAVVQSTN
ncbi:hypothetical protein ACH4E8_13435 [Streptomyces sp. NPDC017979]|uniref:hypothetical protein n=1 Tax=Streptomyces sp. NPDC017979 TaxID=3365024 RepID=UPI00379C81BB